jgi:lipoprotein-anchoring transpeptidase ErfK/SrfK
MQLPSASSSLRAVLSRCALAVAAAFMLSPAMAAPAKDAPAATAKKADKSKPAAKKPAKATDKKQAAKSAKGKKAEKQAAKKPSGKATAKKAPEPKFGPLADFGKADAPQEVKHVANWVSYTRNNQKKAFVVIDKKAARMYVFDRGGKLKSDSPILLGKAIGDHTAPGVGNKPLSQIKEDEKTTPAGKFLAIPGKNNHGEDIIWIDYNAAVSMHRMRKVSAKERRAERMNTADASDNRISNGCVNVPHAFYDKVLRPTVHRQGAYVYVLPETKTPQQLFGSYDVADKAVQVADAGKPRAGK